MADDKLVPPHERERIKRELARLVAELGTEEAVADAVGIAQPSVNRGLKGKAGPKVVLRVDSYLRERGGGGPPALVAAIQKLGNQVDPRAVEMVRSGRYFDGIETKTQTQIEALIWKAHDLVQLGNDIGNAPDERDNVKRISKKK
jgi:predicted transcriptional regulator